MIRPAELKKPWTFTSDTPLCCCAASVQGSLFSPGTRGYLDFMGMFERVTDVFKRSGTPRPSHVVPSADSDEDPGEEEAELSVPGRAAQAQPQDGAHLPLAGTQEVVAAPEGSGSLQGSDSLAQVPQQQQRQPGSSGAASGLLRASDGAPTGPAGDGDAQRSTGDEVTAASGSRAASGTPEAGSQSGKAAEAADGSPAAGSAGGEAAAGASKPLGAGESADRDGAGGCSIALGVLGSPRADGPGKTLAAVNTRLT